MPTAQAKSKVASLSSSRVGRSGVSGSPGGKAGAVANADAVGTKKSSPSKTAAHAKGKSTDAAPSAADTTTVVADPVNHGVPEATPQLETTYKVVEHENGESDEGEWAVNTRGELMLYKGTKVRDGGATRIGPGEFDLSTGDLIEGQTSFDFSAEVHSGTWKLDSKGSRTLFKGVKWKKTGTVETGTFDIETGELIDGSVKMGDVVVPRKSSWSGTTRVAPKSHNGSPMDPPMSSSTTPTNGYLARRNSFKVPANMSSVAMEGEFVVLPPTRERILREGTKRYPSGKVETGMYDVTLGSSTMGRIMSGRVVFPGDGTSHEGEWVINSCGMNVLSTGTKRWACGDVECGEFDIETGLLIKGKVYGNDGKEYKLLDPDAIPSP